MVRIGVVAIQAGTTDIICVGNGAGWSSGSLQYCRYRARRGAMTWQPRRAGSLPTGWGPDREALVAKYGEKLDYR